MQTVQHTIEGRDYFIQVPDGETNFDRGLIIGPPDLDALKLPKDVTDRLHRELFVRGLITKKDIQRRRSEVFAALQSAFGVTTEKLMELY